MLFSCCIWSFVVINYFVLIMAFSVSYLEHFSCFFCYFGVRVLVFTSFRSACLHLTVFLSGWFGLARFGCFVWLGSVGLVWLGSVDLVWFGSVIWFGVVRLFGLARFGWFGLERLCWFGLAWFGWFGLAWFG